MNGNTKKQPKHPAKHPAVYYLYLGTTAAQEHEIMWVSGRKAGQLEWVQDVDDLPHYAEQIDEKTLMRKIREVLHKSTGSLEMLCDFFKVANKWTNVL